MTIAGDFQIVLAGKLKDPADADPIVARWLEHLTDGNVLTYLSGEGIDVSGWCDAVDALRRKVTTASG